MPRVTRSIPVWLLVCGFTATAGAAEPTRNWPQFRGPGASGLGLGAALPNEFDVAGGQNVRWKTDIPGLGLGAPVVWGDQVFVTTAVSPKDNSLKVGLYGDIQPVEMIFRKTG